MKRMVRFTTVLGTAVVLLLSLLVVPSFANGAFTWDGSFQHRLRSRTWNTPDTGIHKVTKFDTGCPGPGNQLRVRLVHEVSFRGDDFYPWDNWACNDTDESSSWRSYKVDSFHFDLEKADTDAKDSWGASGRVDYP